MQACMYGLKMLYLFVDRNLGEQKEWLISKISIIVTSFETDDKLELGRNGMTKSQA